MRLSSGVAKLPEMLKRRVRVGLGVDGSASNDTSDMLGELRSCLLVQLLTHGPDAVSAERVVRLATRGGADILGRDEIGSIEVGKAADIVALDMSRLGYAGAFSDPVAAVVYAGLDHRVGAGSSSTVTKKRSAPLPTRPPSGCSSLPASRRRGRCVRLRGTEFGQGVPCATDANTRDAGGYPPASSCRALGMARGTCNICQVVVVWMMVMLNT
jgi:hypothetical protein